MLTLEVRAVSRAAGEESVVKDVLQPDRDDVSTVGEIEIAPMAGIEPATGALVTQQIGSAKAVHRCPHICIIDANVTLARRETRIAKVAEPARRAPHLRVHRCGC